MKKILFIVQMLLPYLLIGIQYFIGCMYGNANASLLEKVDHFSIVVFIVLCLANTIYGLFIAKYLTARELLFWGMVIKIVSIPYFLLIFVIGIAAITTIFGMIAILLLFILDYIVLLPSSVLCMNGLIKAKKENDIPIIVAFILSVCQYVFCLDVIAAILANICIKKENYIR